MTTTPAVRTRTALRTLAAAAVTISALAACSVPHTTHSAVRTTVTATASASASSTSSGAEDTATSTSDPTDSWPSTSDATPTDPPTATVPDELDDVLLTPTLVGSDFAPTASGPPQPLPCTPDEPPVDDQISNVEKGAVDFASSDGTVEVSEQVYVYGSETEAIRHQQIDEQGLACSYGVMGPAAVDISSPEDVADQLDSDRIDTAEAWGVSNSDLNGELIFVRVHAVVVQFSFVADADTTPEVDAQAVVNSGIARILASA